MCRACSLYRNGLEPQITAEIKECPHTFLSIEHMPWWFLFFSIPFWLHNSRLNYLRTSQSCWHPQVNPCSFCFFPFLFGCTTADSTTYLPAKAVGSPQVNLMDISLVTVLVVCCLCTSGNFNFGVLIFLVLNVYLRHCKVCFLCTGGNFNSCALIFLVSNYSISIMATVLPSIFVYKPQCRFLCPDLLSFQYVYSGHSNEASFHVSFVQVAMSLLLP